MENSTIEISDYLLNDPQVLGYNSTIEQELLFLGLLHMYSPNQSILDVGCGRADLFGFLKRAFPGNEIMYTGLDYNPNILEVAKLKYPGVHTISTDLLNSDDSKFDWVFASGIFNLRDRDEIQMTDYAKLCIDKMMQKANVGVAVNFLTDFPAEYSDEDKSKYVAHDSGLWLNYLIKTYKKVISRTDYMEGDVTFIILK